MSKLAKAIQAAAGNAGGDKLYVEDVFSTYLYTGNGSTQTINNGIDLDGEGGLVWIKNRIGTNFHLLMDTERGGGNILNTNTTGAETVTTAISFNTNGFNLLNNNGTRNRLDEPYASWTFRKAPKFFDVVTYTGDGVAGRTVAHNLESVPGTIIVKKTSGTSNWPVWHRNLTSDNHTLLLNLTGAQDETGYFNNTAPTDSNFTVSTSSLTNGSGQTYVAYLFAHDAGGFGDDGEQNVVSCGSYTGNGANGQSISLGYEPQWLLIKRTDSSVNWFLQDNMRPFNVTATEWLNPNTSNAESTGGVAYVSPTATGFTFTSGGSSAYNASGGTYIYIAIRRGPMKTPESGTEVFALQQDNDPDNNAPAFRSSFPVDAAFSKNAAGTSINFFGSRLQGATYLRTNEITAEIANSDFAWDYMNGWHIEPAQGPSVISWMFRRAPSFFDVVAYTGTGANKTEAHNLAAAPELWIVKGRSGATAWRVGCTALANTEALVLNTTAAKVTDATSWNSTFPSSTVLSLGTQANVNTNTATYVAYLFATVAGVSKVGSYTGTGTTLAIDCGFSAGARFVLIKRTDSTGDWYVWDTARGIVAGNDPYLLLNSTAAEVTNTDYIDPSSAGFEISSTAPVAINASGGSYIFLAIA